MMGSFNNMWNLKSSSAARHSHGGRHVGKRVRQNAAVQPVVAERLEQRVLLSLNPTTPIAGITGNASYQAAPPITTTYTDGTAFTIPSVNQPILVMDLWASWCGYCMEGMPGTNDFNTWVQQNQKPVKVVTVNEGDSLATIQSTWASLGFTLPTILDGEWGTIYTNYATPTGADGIPLYVMVTGNKIFWSQDGYAADTETIMENEVNTIVPLLPVANPITVTPGGNQTANAGQSQLFTLGSFTQANLTSPYSVDIGWGDGSADTVFSMANPGTIPSAAHSYTTAGNYTVTETVTDSGNDTSNSPTFTVTVNAAAPVTPAFIRLSPSASISQGTAAVTLGGTIAAGAAIPPSSEDVAITLDGVTQDASIGSLGNFSSVFSTASLPASATPYQVTYAYGGDANFTSATDNSATKLTVTSPLTGLASIAGTINSSSGNMTGLADVMVYLDTNNNGQLDYTETSVTTDASGNYYFGNLTAGTYTVREVPPGNYTQTSPAAGYINVPLGAGQAATGENFLDTPSGNPTELAVYRLYSPVTLEHLYTTDPNEYNILKSYVGTWNGEGEVFSEYSGAATVSNVTAVPLYRLYDAPLKQHFWTNNYNEYNTLRQAPWNWNDEDIAGYVFPTVVASSMPLYRLMAPNVHLWTTDLNEYSVLSAEGWTQEGVIGYVM